MGDTPNLAARIQGLAQPNTVALSATTARLIQGVFALEDLGTHALKGVAEPMPVSRVLRPIETHHDEEEVRRWVCRCWWGGTRNVACCGGAGTKPKRDWGRSCWSAGRRGLANRP